jgi:hypothetical protein
MRRLVIQSGAGRLGLHHTTAKERPLGPEEKTGLWPLSIKEKLPSIDEVS